MILNRDEALYCAKAFDDYFSNIGSTEEYMRDEKLKNVADMPSSLFPIEDDLFSDFSMHPNDMDIQVCEIPNETWESLLAITSSHINKAPVGKNIQLAVIEKNSGKILGFIRLGSPVIYMKPRNDYLGQVWIQNEDTAICNKKYGMNLCLFETTSLYGTTKTVSQYDGMKPYIRFKGLTESDIVPMMHGQRYHDLKNYVENITGDLLAGDTSTTSRKLRTFTKIIALTKAALKGTTEGDAFNLTIENAKKLTEKKRYYISDYGFKNTVDYMNCKTDKLLPGENYKKHELSNIIEWWRTKAINRYETLRAEGRLRTELEIWTSGKDIQIIR